MRPVNTAMMTTRTTKARAAMTTVVMEMPCPFLSYIKDTMHPYLLPYFKSFTRLSPEHGPEPEEMVVEVGDDKGNAVDDAHDEGGLRIDDLEDILPIIRHLGDDDQIEHHDERDNQRDDQVVVDFKMLNVADDDLKEKPDRQPKDYNDGVEENPREDHQKRDQDNGDCKIADDGDEQGYPIDGFVQRPDKGGLLVVRPADDVQCLLDMLGGPFPVVVHRLHMFSRSARCLNSLDALEEGKACNSGFLMEMAFGMFLSSGTAARTGFLVNEAISSIGISDRKSVV